MKDLKQFIKTTIREFLNENIEFLLDKESDEYNHITNDYGIKDINKVHSDIVKFSKEAIETFKNKVDLFNDIRIVFVNNIGKGALGRFRSGTSSSTPIVLLSEKDILKGSKKYDVPLWVAVETTILHELGHAICELEYDAFGYEYLEYGDEEEWVENFAYELHNYGDIPQDLETFIQEYKKQIKLIQLWKNKSKIVKKVIKENDQKVMLRKMTKKSVLGDEGGIYRNWTVQKLLDNAPKKVFQIYTNYEKITFVDEVLDELKEKGFPVKPIQKPGVDKEQYREYMEKGSSKFYSNLESKSIEDILKLIKARKINKQSIDPNIYKILDKKRQDSDDSHRLNKNVERKFVMASKNQDKFRK